MLHLRRNSTATRCATDAASISAAAVHTPSPCCEPFALKSPMNAPCASGCHLRLRALTRIARVPCRATTASAHRPLQSPLSRLQHHSHTCQSRLPLLPPQRPPPLSPQSSASPPGPRQRNSGPAV